MEYNTTLITGDTAIQPQVTGKQSLIFMLPSQNDSVPSLSGWNAVGNI